MQLEKKKLAEKLEKKERIVVKKARGRERAGEGGRMGGKGETPQSCHVCNTNHFVFSLISFPPLLSLPPPPPAFFSFLFFFSFFFFSFLSILSPSESPTNRALKRQSVASNVRTRIVLCAMTRYIAKGAVQNT